MKGDGLSCCSILGLQVPIIGHRFPASYGREAGARLLVKKMQRQRFHARRYIDAQERMPRWM
jgi:hypothetical protein